MCEARAHAVQFKLERRGRRHNTKFVWKLAFWVADLVLQSAGWNAVTNPLLCGLINRCPPTDWATIDYP